MKLTGTMKPNELRIGNWVFSKTSEANYKVKGIKFNGELWLKNKDDSFWESNGIKYIEPIPLTEEWLLKFGFIKEAKSEFYIEAFSPGHPSARFEIEWRNNGLLLKSRYQESNDDLKMRHIKHVHQLQNLFLCLTGTELELKDFTKVTK